MATLVRSAAGVAILLAIAASFVAVAPAPAAAGKPDPPPPAPPAPAPAPTEPDPNRIMIPSPDAAAPKKPAAAAPAGPTRIEPRAWPRSTYALDGRVEIAVGKVTFTAPPAYQESFGFWTQRMAGTIRTELVQFILSTREAAPEGRLPFRRQVTRYSMEMTEKGQIKQAGSPLTQSVQRLIWEGEMDARGNLANVERSGAPENPKEIDQLAFPLLDDLFPRLEGARTLKGGESFEDVVSMPLPSRLTVRGLEEQRVLATRRFTLREADARQAKFDVSVRYASDPATPPTAPRTTCRIGGGGEGEAVFDLKEGLFVSMRQPTQMTIDIEAPLRVLPGQPEGTDPGTATMHLPIGLTLSGKRTMTRLFDDPPLAPPVAETASGAAKP